VGRSSTIPEPVTQTQSLPVTHSLTAVNWGLKLLLPVSQIPKQGREAGGEIEVYTQVHRLVPVSPFYSYDMGVGVGLFLVHFKAGKLRLKEVDLAAHSTGYRDLQHGLVMPKVNASVFPAQDYGPGSPQSSLGNQQC
jgi:hypothetical protein